MPWYKAGTITVTNGSPNVVGSGTTWGDGAVPEGAAFSLVDANGAAVAPHYEVLEVIDDLHLTLKEPYGGASASGVKYALWNLAGEQTTPYLSALVSSLVYRCKTILSSVIESVTRAETARDDAEAARDEAQTARQTAVSASGTATQAKTAAQTARDEAVVAKNAAVTAKSAAESAKTAAANSASAAASSAAQVPIASLLPAAGRVPKAGTDGKIDRGWQPLFTAASSSAAGQAGAVPAPAATNQPFYLLSNGTWARGVATTFIGDENINLNNLTDSGTYAFLASAMATILNAPTTTVGIMEVYGNNAGQLYQRYTTYNCVVYIRRGAKNGAFTDWIQLGPPYAQTTEGIGQWVKIEVTDGTPYYLPAGGRWEYFLLLFNASTGAFYNFSSYVYAGGTKLFEGSTLYKYIGFAKRVS